MNFLGAHIAGYECAFDAGGLTEVCVVDPALWAVHLAALWCRRRRYGCMGVVARTVLQRMSMRSPRRCSRR